MNKLDPVLSKACDEITQNLLTIQEPSKKQVKEEIIKICTKYALERIPRNYEILSMAKESDFDKLKKVLLRKPAKTASGVSVVALMPKPYACPHGRCTYCPGGIEFNSPNSYTGKEPSSLNAIENEFDPKLQITSKIEKLIAFGHDPSKMEIVIVGGTFLFMPKDYQRDFIKSCYDALNGTDSKDLEEAKSNNEHAAIRNVGFTIETKPDYCKKEHVDLMLSYGITRIEIGVQSLQERVYEIVNRGHNYKDVVESFQISKDAGYKIVAHMMPGLPTMTPEGDIADFKKLFSDPQLRPDMLKIYPSLVIENTPLYEEHKQGKYTPYSDEDMIKVLTEAKRNVPKWVRIMRVNRDIPTYVTSAGIDKTNLRQYVEQIQKKRKITCNCIRCKEAGRNKKIGKAQITVTEYQASESKEFFIAAEDKNNVIMGFCRLRFPSQQLRKEINKKTAIVRELHVYSSAVAIGKDAKDKQVQHRGFGKKLMEKAEELALEHGKNKMLVISGIGAKEYYKKLGYGYDGVYMGKKL